MQDEFFRREKYIEEKNKIKNKPIVFATYITVFIFLCLFGYLVVFMIKDADTVIANTGNKRQDSFAKTIIRGDIKTSDGTVVATTKVDGDTETREYPMKEMFCHVVGYNQYGRSGIELSENFNLLRSNVNIFAKVKNELSNTKNQGDTVVLTLNYKLQSAAYEALGNNKGAVVVIEPSTGKILAMVSKPGYDPNEIEEVWDYIHTDEGSKSTVLLNRATQGLYAPGSTFKVLTMLEYMRENPDYNSYSYECKAKAEFNDVVIHCSNEKKHGKVSLADSLAKSCNTSFTNMGVTLDLSKYSELMNTMLFNSDLPFDGNYKKSSFVLDASSSKNEVPQTVIGQGKTQITPLHNALIYSAIANGGVMMKPYLVDSIENCDGATIKKYKSSSYKTVMTANEAKDVTELLKGVCTYGTASSSFKNTKYKVAGKTGTAEYDNQGNCNSWFVGFSNPDDPDILVSVVVEDSSSSNLTGVKVAKKIFDAYYK